MYFTTDVKIIPFHWDHSVENTFWNSDSSKTSFSVAAFPLGHKDDSYSTTHSLNYQVLLLEAFFALCCMLQSIKNMAVQTEACPQTHSIPPKINPESPKGLSDSAKHDFLWCKQGWTFWFKSERHVWSEPVRSSPRWRSGCRSRKQRYLILKKICDWTVENTETLRVDTEERKVFNTAATVL